MRQADLTALLATVRPRRAAEQLAAVPPDLLAATIADPATPWYQRRYCALALPGRVPATHAPALLAFARSDEEVHSRAAVVLALATSPGPHRAELLAWLRTEPEPDDTHFPVAALQGRVALGDVTAARPLAVQAADDRWFRSRPGTAALDDLVAAHGLDAVLAEFGAADAESLAREGTSVPDRLCGVRLWHGVGGNVVAALADPARRVARLAHDLLVAGPRPDPADLSAMASGDGPGAVWALAVLLAHGYEHPASVLPVPLPGVPADVRAAIVAKWAPGLRDTDPRWLVEKARTRPVLDPPVVAEAVALLAAAGSAPADPVPAGTHHGSGRGTYDVIAVTGGHVMISALGRFARDHPAGVTGQALTGFRMIDRDLGRIVVDGLVVYSFGRREPLTVLDLLFHWQD